MFSRLAREALETLASSTDLVFNTPNEKSGPGYLKLGWQRIGRIPASVRVRRPVAFASAIRSLRRPASPTSATLPVLAPSAAEALEDEDEVRSLLERAVGEEPRLHTPVDLPYLRWRYGGPPGLAYHAVREEAGGTLRGLAIFRVRRRGGLWEGSVAEAIVAPGERRTAGRLLRGVAAASPVDHLACVFPSGTTPARAALRRGFVRWPYGPTLMVNALRPGLVPDPSTLRSWALTLGDVEVF